MATLNSPPQASQPPLPGPDAKLRRRSSRVTIQIAVEVICKDAQNAVRVEETHTAIVSAHGCALALKQGVLPGEKVVLIHKVSREEVVCRVVACRQGKGGQWEAGLEFQRPSPKFWHIAFPPEDWDPAVFEASPPPKK